MSNQAKVAAFFLGLLMINYLTWALVGWPMVYCLSKPVFGQMKTYLVFANLVLVLFLVGAGFVFDGMGFALRVVVGIIGLNVLAGLAGTVFGLGATCGRTDEVTVAKKSDRLRVMEDKIPSLKAAEPRTAVEKPADTEKVLLFFEDGWQGPKEDAPRCNLRRNERCGRPLERQRRQEPPVLVGLVGGILSLPATIFDEIFR